MEDQELIIVKESFLTKIAKAFKKIFSRGKNDELLLNEAKEKKQAQTEVELINDTEYVQLEILDARRAFRKYVINNNKNIAKEIFDYVQGKLQENEVEIRQLIDINNDEITYEDIVKFLKEEEKNIGKFKFKNEKTGRYCVPVGVIGIECADAKDAIQNIFKSISTRNAIMILHDNYSKYSTEALVLLIVKECLKNFYIDDNIIQMFEKEEIDLTKLDRVIPKSDENLAISNISTELQKISSNDTANQNTIYIYQEDETFANDVQEEIQRLQNNDIYKSYNIKPIKGEFGNVVNYLQTNNNASAVCMYTNNTQKAYKFINWTNSPNVFVNTGVKSCKEIGNDAGGYFSSKYVLHEDVF